jgi:nitrogen regulatory protein PII
MIASSMTPVVTGMTVWQILDDSPETNRRIRYRGCEYDVHLPAMAVEIVTDDSWLDDVISRLTNAQKDGLIGGRGIQVFPVEESYRIRDGFMIT